MKTNSSVISAMLMAIAAIILLLVGISEGSILFIIAGILFFIAIFLMRLKQTRKLNKDIEKMEKDIENEISNSDDQ